MTDQYPARREKLLDVWATIRAKLEQRRVRRVTTRQFVEYAWQSFDVKEVTSILSSPQESYFGHKDILFAGLCAWVACPGKPALVKHAITVTTARLLDAAERAGRDMYRDIPQIGDIYIRIHQLGYEFYIIRSAVLASS
jgi:hypothetical protein